MITQKALITRLRKAYKKIGYKPCKRAYLDETNKECCGSYALFLAEVKGGNTGIYYTEVRKHLAEVIVVDSVWYFIGGWDSKSGDKCSHQDRADIALWKLGRACAKALMPTKKRTK